MEALGFIDRPGTTSTWATGATSTTSGDVVSSPETESHTIDSPMADWRPSEIGERLLSGNVRWSVVVAAAISVALLGLAAFWLYEQPQRADTDAYRAVTREASAMREHLDALAALSIALADESPVPDSLALDLAGADGQARALFDVAGGLHPRATATRSNAADLAGETLAASRLLRDAFAYRTAAIPILAMPVFETDSSLIQLDEAAIAFGEWQFRFDQVRAALPGSVLSEVTSELDLISGELTSAQSRYLDSLRRDDPASAAAALADLAHRLQGVEGLLGKNLTEIQGRVALKIGAARSSLDLLVG